MNRLLVSVVVLSVVWSMGGRALADYVYTTLEVPGASSTFAFGINNAGEIVGEFRTGSPTGPYHGFLYSGNGYTQLDVPGTVSGTIASGINTSGQIVGSYNQGANGVGSGSAFLLSGGTYTTLPTPPFAGLLGLGAGGINDRGQIVGNYTVLDFPRGQPPSLVFVGFLFSGGSYAMLPGSASGLNNAGQIVLINGGQSSVLSGGTLTPVSVPGSTYTEALGINNLGQIVGTYTDQSPSSGQYHGFLYHDGMYTSFDVPGSTYTQAFGINDLGQITGWYIDAAGNDRAFLATPTPEPSTLVLLGTGVLGVIAHRWRKRRALSRVSA